MYLLLRDGKWMVSGTSSGQGAKWGAGSHAKVNQFNGCRDWVYVLDVSPDPTKNAVRAVDTTAHQ